VSQSPIDDFSAKSVARYEQGWAALNKLLHQDHSFSSHERDTAFLNTGGERFADVSAACGLDHPGDGRAVAAADWDFDGDLDLWLTDRTAPRVRFLRNDDRSGHHFVAVRLEGNGVNCNRDAIGARVTLDQIPGLPGKSIRTRRAGDAFLSQSTEWLHFGLADSVDMGRLSVRWPDGKVEKFEGLSADGFFNLRQGTGKAKRWQPPQIPKPWNSGSPEVASDSTDVVRIVLPVPVPIPDGPFVDATQKRVLLSDAGSGPLLVNLWATWCQPCVKELEEWTRHEQEISSTGLSVLALHVDHPDIPSDSDESQQALWTQLKCNFARGVASDDLVRSLDLLQRGVLDRWRPLPVPSSFLLDANRRVVVIYKGPVAVEQLLADAELVAPDAAGKRIAAALPLGGRGFVDPTRVDPIPIAEQFIDHGLVRAAISFLHSATRDLDPTTMSEFDKGEFADSKYVVGVLLREDKQPALARGAFEQAVQLNPRDIRARRELVKLMTAFGEFDAAAEQLRAGLVLDPKNVEMFSTLGTILLQQGRAREAIEQFARAIAVKPDDPFARLMLADAHCAAGEYAEGMTQYRLVLAGKPNWQPAANNLAWLLATHPDERLRDGSEALRLIESLIESTDAVQPNLLDTLAAAYAENNRFDEAAATAGKGVELARQAGNNELAEKLDLRRRQYDSKQPWRDKTLLRASMSPP